MTARVAGRLGRLPHDPARPRLRLRPALDLAAPATVDWLSRVPEWPMYANDRLSDCVFAAIGHARQAWTAYATGSPDTLPVDGVIAAYSAVTGYTPADPSTDRGAVMADALSYWRATGVGGHRILAYAHVDCRDEPELRAALNLFGALLVGVALPANAMRQFRDGQPWDLDDPDGGLLGGHAVHLGADTETGGYRLVTWGREQQATHRWLAAHAEEAWAVLTPEWLDATGHDPQGLDLAALAADFQVLTGQPDPFTEAPA